MSIDPYTGECYANCYDCGKLSWLEGGRFCDDCKEANAEPEEKETTMEWILDPTANYTTQKPERLMEVMGFIPQIIPGQRSAEDEITDGYAHGGGFHPFEGFTISENGTMTYPEDPPHHPIAVAVNAVGEEVRIYENAWVSIRNPKTLEYVVVRMD